MIDKKEERNNIFLSLEKNLTEKVPDAASSNSDKHFIKLRPRGVVKGHIRLSSHGSGKKGLSSSWRANQENT